MKLLTDYYCIVSLIIFKIEITKQAYIKLNLYFVLLTERPQLF